MDVDLRSEAPAELTRLDAAFKTMVRESVDEENRARSTAAGKIDATLTVTGDRPSGETSRSSELVQLSAAAATKFGFTPTYEFQSTDANIPISLGIPAIATVQGIGGNAHAPDEWTDVDPATSGRIARAVLATIAAAAGIP
jgi:acetylornithine deacetylase/succinyl-diaminopimelate desuccinylase-like protein